MDKPTGQVSPLEEKPPEETPPETKPLEEVELKLPVEPEPENIADAAKDLKEVMLQVKMEEVKSLGEALLAVTSLASELKEIASMNREALDQIQRLKIEIEQATLQTAEAVMEIAQEVQEEVTEEPTKPTEIISTVESNPAKKTGLRVFLG